jgi:hypothetical protein
VEKTGIKAIDDHPLIFISHGFKIIKENGRIGVYAKGDHYIGEKKLVIPIAYIYIEVVKCNSEWIFIVGDKDPSTKKMRYNVRDSEGRSLIYENFKWCKIVESSDERSFILGSCDGGFCLYDEEGMCILVSDTPEITIADGIISAKITESSCKRYDYYGRRISD